MTHGQPPPQPRACQLCHSSPCACCPRCLRPRGESSTVSACSCDVDGTDDGVELLLVGRTIVDAGTDGSGRTLLRLDNGMTVAVSADAHGARPGVLHFFTARGTQVQPHDVKR